VSSRISCGPDCDGNFVRTLADVGREKAQLIQLLTWINNSLTQQSLTNPQPDHVRAVRITAARQRQRNNQADGVVSANTEWLTLKIDLGISQPLIERRLIVDRGRWQEYVGAAVQEKLRRSASATDFAGSDKRIFT
jgi:hypothetical protein